MTTVLPAVAGILSATQVAATADTIASVQLASGMIPWYPGGHADPCNHVEAAMALDVAGRRPEAEAAYDWLVRGQRPDGAWHQYYLADRVEADRLDANVCAYVATGAWHHFLCTGDTGFLESLWPVVDAAVTFVLGLQTRRGEILWARHADGTPWSFALLTGASSIFHSLGCALAAARRLGHHHALGLVDARLDVAAREHRPRAAGAEAHGGGRARVQGLNPVLAVLPVADELEAVTVARQGHVRRLGLEQDARGVLGAKRRERLRELGWVGLVERLLDRQLGLLVGALAVVQEAQPVAAVEEVAARPALVSVQAPDGQVGVDGDRVGDLEPLDGAPDRLHIAPERVPGRVHPDHLEPVVAVALAPALQVGKRSQRVDPREVPELEQHRPRRRRPRGRLLDVQPCELGRELGRRDPGLGRRTHAPSIAVGRLPGEVDRAPRGRTPDGPPPARNVAIGWRRVPFTGAAGAGRLVRRDGRGRWAAAADRQQAGGEGRDQATRQTRNSGRGPEVRGKRRFAAN